MIKWTKVATDAKSLFCVREGNAHVGSEEVYLLVSSDNSVT